MKHIEGYWNVDEERELPNAFTGFTRFDSLNERPADGRCRRECGLEVTVWEQQGQRIVKHESGQGELDKSDMRMQQTLLHNLGPCVYVHT